MRADLEPMHRQCCLLWVELIVFIPEIVLCLLHDLTHLMVIWRLYLKGSELLEGYGFNLNYLEWLIG